MKEQFLDDIGLEELIGYIKKYVKDDQDVKPYASYSVFPKTGEQNIIYIDTTNNLTYYWDDTSKTYKALDVQTWDNLSGKPSTFPPSTHNHDDRYYTETEINTKLAGKANSSHTHKKADITDFPTSMPASDVKAWAKADTKPSYSKSEVGLGNVDNTADKDKSVKYATSAGAASSVDWSGVKNKPGTYPPSTHNHNIESLTNFNARVYDAAGTRAANTVLAAPSDSDGTARFRKLVAADLPSHTHNYAGSASAGGAANSSLSLYLNPSTRQTSGDYDMTSSTYACKVTHSVASTIMKTGRPPEDSSVLTFGWDTYAGWGAQLAIGSQKGNHLYVRGANSKQKTVDNKTVNYSEWDSNWRTILDSGNYSSYTVTKTGGGASGNWGINAASASKLTTNAGSSTQPIYFSNGVPVSCVYTLGKSVPSNAVFTDTNTWRPVENSLTSASTSNSLSAAQGKILNELTFQKRNVIDDTVDWDTLKDIGCYKIQMSSWGDADTKHGPNSYSQSLYSFGLLLVFKATDSDGEKRTMQVYFPHQENAGAFNIIMTRMFNNSWWTNWHPIGSGTGWAEILNKPSSYPPSSHTHAISDITDLKSSLDSKLSLSGGTITGQIKRNAGGNWIADRDYAAVFNTLGGGNGYQPVVGQKTATGSWTVGNLGNNESLVFNYCTDANYKTGNNTSEPIYLPAQAGTIITSATIGGQSVNYANSAGKLSTSRTISLTGSVTGSGSFDGSGNLTISTATSHTHNSVADINSGATTTFAYSKAGMGYGDFTWLAAWNGSELRAVNKSLFATTGHTHSYLPLSGGTMGGTAFITWADSWNWSNNNKNVTFPVNRGGLQWNGQSDYVKLFTQETGQDNLELVLQFGDDNSNGLSIRNNVGSETARITASGGFTGTFYGNASTATTAAKLGRDGNTGVPMTFNWSGKNGQPTWLWGGNDGSNMYIYNPSNFSVNYAKSAGTSSSCSGNASTASKLATARNIALGGLSSGSANFDGSGNVTINDWGYGVTKYVTRDSASAPYYRIAYCEVKGSYIDKSVIFTIDSGCNGGGFGIVKVCLRSNNTSTAGQTYCEVTWLVRQGFSADQLLTKVNSPAGTSTVQYADLYFKATGTYNGITVKSLSSTSQRDTVERAWTFTNPGSENCRAQPNIRAYTATYTGYDAGTTQFANKLQTARTIFGHSFDGTGDIGGKGWFYGHKTDAGGRFCNSAIEIRENDLVDNSQSDFVYAPSIGFHWSNRVAGFMALHTDGNFYFRKQNGNDRATIDANLNGNASTASYASSAGNSTKWNGYELDLATNNTTDTWLLVANNGKIQHRLSTSFATAGHTHNYAGSSSVGGAATSANKLNTNAGSATQPIYFSNGVPVACSYALKSTVNNGTTSRLAYYSGANTISQISNVGYYSTKNSKGSIRTVLRVWGPTYGNDKNTMMSNATGPLSWGDGGPQIQFSTGESEAQDGSLIYTDHDSAGEGASFHFVTNQSEWSVHSKRFQAKSGITIGQSLPDKNYNLCVIGNSYMSSHLNMGKDAQIKFTSHGISYISDGNSDAVSSVGGALNNLVISSWNGISFTTSCSGQTYSGKTAVGIDCRQGILRAARVDAGSFNGYTINASVPSGAKFTDTNTWRGIQNNLSSDSTTDSLSAAQGKRLKNLIDEKTDIHNLNYGIKFSSSSMDSNGSQNTLYPAKYENGAYSKTTGVSTYANRNDTIHIGTPANMFGDIYLAGGITSLGVYNVTTTTNLPVSVTSQGYIRRYKSGSSLMIKNHIYKIGYDEAKELLNTNVYSFRYNDDGQPANGKEHAAVNRYGFVLEDMEKTFPMAVEYDEDGLPAAWCVQIIVPTILEIVKHQQAEISSLKAENEELKEKISEIDNLKKSLDELRVLITNK